MALDGFLDYKCEVLPLRGSLEIPLFRYSTVGLAHQQHKLSNSMQLAPHDGEGKVCLDAGTASRRCPSASRPHRSARTCCGWGPRFICFLHPMFMPIKWSKPQTMASKLMQVGCWPKHWVGGCTARLWHCTGDHEAAAAAQCQQGLRGDHPARAGAHHQVPRRPHRLRVQKFQDPESDIAVHTSACNSWQGVHAPGHSAAAVFCCRAALRHERLWRRRGLQVQRAAHALQRACCEPTHTSATCDRSA